jgi:hypothetical protein
LKKDNAAVEPNKQLHEESKIVTRADKIFSRPEENKILDEAQGIQKVGMAGIYKIGREKDSHNRESRGWYRVDVEI